MQAKRRFGRVMTGMCLLAGLVLLSACNRNRLDLTECVEGRPVIARTLDVAPPNC